MILELKVEATCSSETSVDFQRTFILQKTTLLIIRAVRTSNQTWIHLCFCISCLDYSQIVVMT
jgi:hypothetical protein